MRKIIQLIENPDTNYSQGNLTALCDDGTIWFYQNAWFPLLDEIPQDSINDIKKQRNANNEQ